MRDTIQVVVFFNQSAIYCQVLVAISQTNTRCFGSSRIPPHTTVILYVQQIKVYNHSFRLVYHRTPLYNKSKNTSILVVWYTGMPADHSNTLHQ